MKKLKCFLFLLLFSLVNILPLYGADLQIKPGNIVHITVLGYPELSKSVLVRQDGSTDYPLLANIPIDGMTIHQLQEALQPILVRFVERPKLFINIAEHIQFEVTLEGQVNKPGQYTVRGPISLQGVLSVAGGTTPAADLKNITISRRGYESQREITVDLVKFFSDRDGTPMPDIQDGDIIFVPIVSSASTVRVMGAVRSPGVYTPVKDNNIADMIYMAGGPGNNGNMRKILYITMQNGKYHTEMIDLNTLIFSGKNDQIPLAHAGDIIVVKENNWWHDRSWWVSALRDTVLVISSLIFLVGLTS